MATRSSTKALMPARRAGTPPYAPDPIEAALVMLVLGGKQPDDDRASPHWDARRRTDGAA